MAKIEPTNSQLLTIFLHVIFISVGVYYNYDFPQLYEAEIISKFQISTEKLDFLYTIYSLPNFIILIFATPLVAKIGLGMSSILTSGLIFFSSILMFLGFYTNNFTYLIIGRGIIGSGAEICVISVYTIAERWFKGKFLSFAQGSCRALSFASMAFGFYFGPQFLIKTRSMQLSLFICGLVSFTGFLASFGYWVFEKIFKRKLKERRLSLFESLNLESRLTREKEEDDKKKKDFGLKDVKKLSGLFWLLAFLFGFGCQGYYQFLNFATDCLTHRYGYSFEEAKDKLSLLPLIMMILMPIFSAGIVKTGKKGFVLLISFLIFLVNFVLMLNYPETPGNYVYLIIGSISVAYCLFVATIWPCMTLAAPSKATAVALGFGLYTQGVFLTFMPMVFGRLNENRDVKAYNNSIWLLVLMMAVGVLLCFVVIIVDFRTGKLLDLPENDERVAKIRQRMEDEMNE